MYKQILLTDNELNLLASILQKYIDEKKNNSNHEINNTQIILRNLINQKSQQNLNQIAFYGK